MDYRPLIKQKLIEFSEEAPDMSFGEILYSILRKSNLKSKPEGVITSWLLKIDDTEFYTALEKAIEGEVKNREEIK